MSGAPLSRRRFLAAAGGAALLAGCARDAVRETSLVDFLGEEREAGDPLWSPEARAYVAEFPARYLPAAKAAYTDAQYASVALGLVALWIVCPEDRAEVEYCLTTPGFSCPGCGTRYTAVGEHVNGPSPRGLDRYRVEKDAAGGLVLDRGERVRGPAAGIRVLPDPGPTCAPGAASRSPEGTPST